LSVQTIGGAWSARFVDEVEVRERKPRDGSGLNVRSRGTGQDRQFWTWESGLDWFAPLRRAC